MNALGFEPARELRTLGEASMIGQILQWAYPAEVRRGEEASARTGAHAHLNNWIELGLGVSHSKTGERLFDPIEAMNVFVSAGLRGDDPFWTNHFVSAKQREVYDLHPRGIADGKASTLDLPKRRFDVLFNRTFFMAAPHEATAYRMRLPLPLEDNAVVDLSLQLDMPDGAKSRREPGRMDVRLPGSGAPSISLGYSAQFTGSPTGSVDEPLSAADRQLYLGAMEGLIRITPRIAALARQLVADNETPDCRVEKFYDYMLDNFKCGALHYHQIGTDAPCEWPLDTGWYDCQLGSALMCALCRAADIPARIVSGYELHRDNASYHYWVEAWIWGRGWTPFDLLAWHISLAGRQAKWRDVFRGCIDYRMKTQVLPRLFTGSSTIDLASKWRFVKHLAPNGVELNFEDIDHNAVTYRDIIIVDSVIC